MAHIFAGRTVIPRSECIKLPGLRSALQSANSIHVVEELAEQATPGLRFRELIIRDQADAPSVALQMQDKGVVTGAVVGLEDIHIRHNIGLVSVITWIRRGNQWSEEIRVARIREGTITMIPLFMRVVGTQ